MSALFYNLGRSLGRNVIPAIRKSSWVWRSLTGTEAESIRAETQFGQAMAAEFRLKIGTSHEPADLELIQGISRRLTACIRNKERRFRVDIARIEEPTAIALPGGFIFVGSGLLDFTQRDPDELAFVAGHEMGHILRGHALDRMLARIGAEGLSAILSRGLLNPALRQSGLKWLESAHSRQAEFEADEFGTRLASVAGYDPTGALRLFRRLEKLRQEPKGLGDYFASHPREQERAEHIQAVLAEARRLSRTRSAS